MLTRFSFREECGCQGRAYSRPRCGERGVVRVKGRKEDSQAAESSSCGSVWFQVRVSSSPLQPFFLNSCSKLAFTDSWPRNQLETKRKGTIYFYPVWIKNSSTTLSWASNLPGAWIPESLGRTLAQWLMSMVPFALLFAQAASRESSPQR